MALSSDLALSIFHELSILVLRKVYLREMIKYFVFDLLYIKVLNESYCDLILFIFYMIHDKIDFKDIGPQVVVASVLNVLCVILYGIFTGSPIFLFILL